MHMRDGPRNYNENYNRIQNRVKVMTTDYEEESNDVKEQSEQFHLIFDDNYSHSINSLNKNYLDDFVNSIYV